MLDVIKIVVRISSSNEDRVMGRMDQSGCALEDNSVDLLDVAWIRNVERDDPGSVFPVS